MRAFACVLLLVAAVAAAPEGKRDKRGFLSSGWESSHGGWDLGGHGGWDSGISSGWEAPHAKVIHVKKVVEVPKVIEVKKVISVPHVVKVPKVVTYAKLVHEQPHYESHGWW